MLYHAVFDISDASLGLGQLTIADGTHSSIVIPFADLRALDGSGNASALFMHYGVSSWSLQNQDDAQERLLTLARSPIGIAISVQMQAQAAANGWAFPGALACYTVNTTSVAGQYGIGYILGGVNLTLTFTTAAGRNLLGFNSNKSGATGYTGSQIPTYLIKPDMSAVSNPTPDREAGPVASFAMSDSGDVGFGVAMPGAKIERDWTQQWESVAKATAFNAASTHPWTHQHLFQHCRRGYPFCVSGGGFGNADAEMFNLRGEGSAFEAAYATPNNTARRNISYRTYVRARLI